MIQIPIFIPTILLGVIVRPTAGGVVWAEQSKELVSQILHRPYFHRTHFRRLFLPDPCSHRLLGFHPRFSNYRCSFHPHPYRAYHSCLGVAVGPAVGRVAGAEAPHAAPQVPARPPPPHPKVPLEALQRATGARYS